MLVRVFNGCLANLRSLGVDCALLIKFKPLLCLLECLALAAQFEFVLLCLRQFRFALVEKSLIGIALWQPKGRAS